MTHDPPLLLYDDHCGFCTWWVRLILRRDRRGTLRFAPLGGVTAVAIVARHPGLAGADSIVWVDGWGTDAERCAVRSDAALRVAACLGGVWRCAAVGNILPQRWRDALYDLVARHRHRFGGSACPLPDEQQRSRFLE